MGCVFHPKWRKLDAKGAEDIVNSLSTDVDHKHWVSVYVNNFLGMEEMGSSVYWFYFNPSKAKLKV